ncbi:MAG TPA: pyridoxal-dependent decarboxylase [Gemmatimonadaceae bacterium]|nr:pyridoxal-dependent decarboxylase [Gemmatimonadaceae bacterium]
MSESEQLIDPAALFLGPKGENADVFERLLLEAFRDHVFWRRNFHPEDGIHIREQDKRTPAFESAVATLSQELFGLLAELKEGVPFFSPRYVGHMASDNTMASMIGYLATMLYNPNNVAAEGSPVTSRLELEVAAQLASMIGYDPARQWGHLCSGGTIANIEALWVAREAKYLPVAVRWASEDLDVRSLVVRTARGEDAELRSLDLWELLNVAPQDALDLRERFVAAADDPSAARAAVTRHGLAGLGYQQFGLRLAREFGDALLPGVLLVPSTAHYSFAKAARVLGFGEQQVVHVPVDRRFRLDTSAFAETLAWLAKRKQPVIAAVAVMGTTEEGAVDRLDLMAEARRRAASSGLCFHLHADAAWGGYAAAVTWRGDGTRRPLEDVGGWPEEGVYRALCALEQADSVTIDPHKLGFVPYPAGSISFRDRRVRELVAVEAPYLFHDEGNDASFIGRYILEGSKPGAAAAAVWMSHKVLPLNERGYGRLVSDTVRGARALHAMLSDSDWAPFRIVPLPRPDMNIVCFAIAHPALATLEAVNDFVESVYAKMSIGAGQHLRALDYVVTKTTLRPGEYGDAPLPLVEALGFGAGDYRRAGGISVLRCTVMDRYLAVKRGRTDYLADFGATLRRMLAASLP